MPLAKPNYLPKACSKHSWPSIPRVPYPQTEPAVDTKYLRKKILESSNKKSGNNPALRDEEGR
jgi:hypothetical protein